MIKFSSEPNFSEYYIWQEVIKYGGIRLNYQNRKLKILFSFTIILLVFSLFFNFYYIGKNRKYKLYIEEEIMSTLKTMESCIKDVNLLIDQVNKNKIASIEDINNLTINYKEFAYGMQDLIYLDRHIREDEYPFKIEPYYLKIYYELNILNEKENTSSNFYEKDMFTFIQKITEEYHNILSSYFRDINSIVTNDEWVDILYHIDAVNNNYELPSSMLR